MVSIDALTDHVLCQTIQRNIQTNEYLFLILRKYILSRQKTIPMEMTVPACGKCSGNIPVNRMQDSELRVLEDG